MPRLKRLRPPGRESRGRADTRRVRDVDPPGSHGPVRRPPRGRARLLQARGAPLPRAGRGAGVAAALTLAAISSGCGGDRLSHRDFVAKADAICTAYRDATASVTRPRTYAEIVGYVEKALPLYEAALRKLDALEPPSSDEVEVRSWLAADRRVASAVRDLGLAARRHDFPGVTAAASRAQLDGSESRRAAAQLGLHVCARLSGR